MNALVLRHDCFKIHGDAYALSNPIFIVSGKDVAHGLWFQGI